MKRIVLCSFLTTLLLGCTSTTTIVKLEKPLGLEATKNYLPGGVGQPAYTIYERSKWDCNYKTENEDYVCCSREAFSSMSPWKYCLLVDKENNAFAFFELGTNNYRNWPEGKQPIFKRIDK